MRKVLENLELILTAAGLLVIFGVHFLWGDGSWMLAAFTATAVGIIHGAIFWLVRRRQRGIRYEALKDAEGMLKDIVNNQLSIIQFTASLQQREGMALQDANSRINLAVSKINAALNDISEESLSLWKSKKRAPDSLTPHLPQS